MMSYNNFKILILNMEKN